MRWSQVDGGTLEFAAQRATDEPKHSVPETASEPAGHFVGLGINDEFSRDNDSTGFIGEGKAEGRDLISTPGELDEDS